MAAESPEEKNAIYDSTIKNIQSIISKYSRANAYIRKNPNTIAIKWKYVSGTSAETICTLFKQRHGSDKFNYIIKADY